MKRTIIQKFIWIFMFMAGVYASEAQNNINQMDDDGQRHGVWKKFYSNNRVRYVGTFDHGKEIGLFK